MTETEKQDERANLIRVGAEIAQHKKWDYRPGDIIVSKLTPDVNGILAGKRGTRYLISHVKDSYSSILHVEAEDIKNTMIPDLRNEVTARRVLDWLAQQHGFVSFSTSYGYGRYTCTVDTGSMGGGFMISVADVNCVFPWAALVCIFWDQHVARLPIP